MPDRSYSKDQALAALTPPSGSTPNASGAGAGTPPQFVTGSVFASRYRMIAPLGAATLGEFWRADDLVMQTPVALKVLAPTAADARQRILDEVRLSRQVTHPAVCRIFDVGEADGCVFYSREFVEGEDLATLIRRAGRLPVERVTDIGAQLCEGLAAAHAQRVLHGNLTPANVLLDGNGFVRIIDLGITVDGVGNPLDRPYKAPEQFKSGGQVSERSDIYAVGAILYELLAGQAPALDGTGRLQTSAKLSRLVPEVDSQLDRLVTDALAPDPNHRPVSAATMAAGLRGAEPPRRLPWLWIVGGSVLLIAVLTGIASFFYWGGPAPLSSRDTLVVADFTNTTGETVFDGALNVALAVALEQSPFLKVFPDERIRETLRLMERSPDERITRNLAREIAVREQLKALVAGSIATLGSHYVVTVEAVNAQSGDGIAREQVEVPDREQVLSALGIATSRLRAKLGESLASVQRFDVPLARATTASLDALHAYSLALDDGRVNLRVEAIPHLERAIELDPQFAMAQALLSGIYANTGRTAEAPAYSRRAFELRDRVSERERFFISWRYFIDSAQAWDQALSLATSWTRTYPREPFAFNSLGMAIGSIGRHEPAIDAFRTAISLDPRFVPPHGNLAGSLIASGRYDEASTVIRAARAQGIDGLSLYRATYALGAVANDPAAMARALDAARSTPIAALPSINWEAHSKAFVGQLGEAHVLFQRAVQESADADLKEQAGQWQADDAESHALAGQCPVARPEVFAALNLSRDNFTMQRAARTLALCGADTDASSLAAELGRRFPEATLTRQIQLPVIAAILELRNQPGGAIDRLDPVRPYDDAPSAEFWPGYVRGLAYLRLKDGKKASLEFARIISHRGEAPTSVIYPLATLGTARAAALQGDTARAKTAYAEFFRLWHDADAHLTPLDDAHREAAALR